MIDASRTLFTALDGRVYFKQFTVMVPQRFSDSYCRWKIDAPSTETPYRVSQLIKLIAARYRRAFCN